MYGFYSPRSEPSKIENPKKFQREFESFQKKFVGSKNEIWFDSLDERRQWDLLFLWKKHKYWHRNKTSLSFKKFMYSIKQSRKFKVSTQRLREVALNKIIEL
jgi:hypothetical protein